MASTCLRRSHIYYASLEVALVLLLERLCHTSIRRENPRGDYFVVRMLDEEQNEASWEPTLFWLSGKVVWFQFDVFFKDNSASDALKDEKEPRVQTQHSTVAVDCATLQRETHFQNSTKGKKISQFQISTKKKKRNHKILGGVRFKRWSKKMETKLDVLDFFFFCIFKTKPKYIWQKKWQLFSCFPKKDIMKGR